MSSFVAKLRPVAVRMVSVAAATVLVLAGTLVVTATPAQAHGSTIDPMSRNYSCWKRWGSDFQNPAMATQDPMCWNAWQTNTQAMWNWNGLYIEGLNGAYETGIPDGKICSAGSSGNTTYDTMNVPGNWTATNISNSSSFSVKYHDQARHGADFIRIYVSRQGYNPLTTPLKWSDLERVTTTGVLPPGSGQTESDPVLNGVSNTIQTSAPGRTGRHVVLTIWKASHSDQTYYFCADVNFGGSGGVTTPPTTPVTTRPTTPPTTRPPTTPPTTPATTRPPTTAPTTPGGGSGGCSATYKITGTWGGGFQAEVAVANTGSTAISGWTVTWTFANGQAITQIWGGLSAPNGAVQTVKNVSYNGSVAPGSSTTFGFLGSQSGTNAVPAVSCSAS